MNAKRTETKEDRQGCCPFCGFRDNLAVYVAAVEVRMCMRNAKGKLRVRGEYDPEQAVRTALFATCTTCGMPVPVPARELEAIFPGKLAKKRAR